MALNVSRDDIAYKIFGRKFNALSLESKQYVNKTYGVMLQASRAGQDPNASVRQAAFNETVSIVKQLRQIATNPGDVIELPKGVLEDAARVVHYQSQAVGRGRILSPKDMNEIKKAVKKEFGDAASPQVVECVADYLSNTKGRFSGVGIRTLRRKLGSFLTKEELATISNDEIATARDITIAKMFDTFSGGNLSSFVKPRVESLLQAEVKNLKKTQPASGGVSLDKGDIRKTVENLEAIAKMQSDTRSLSHPIIRRAMQNLGLTPEMIASEAAKENVGEVANLTHAAISQKYKTHPKLGGGIRFTKNRRLHTKASSEYRESLPKKVVGRGIGKPTTVGSRYRDKKWHIDLPKMWESQVDGASYQNLTDEGEWGKSEDIPVHDVDYEAAYGGYVKDAFKQRYAYNAVQAGFSTEIDGINYGYDKEYLLPQKILGANVSKQNISAADWVPDIYTSRITPYAGSVTHQESERGLSRIERAMMLQDVERYEMSKEMYLEHISAYLGPKWGAIWGRKLFEAGVPYDQAIEAIRITDNQTRNAAIKELISSNLEGTSRLERDLKVNPDEFSPFSPSIYAAALEENPTMPLIRRLQNYKGSHPAAMKLFDLPEQIEHEIKAAAMSPGPVEGIKRVGVVGSKSWDNDAFMQRWMSKNWDSSNLMITSSEVGKAGQDANENIGAAFQASNWAYWNQALQYKFPTRNNKYGKDVTTDDVINASDEVIAFFDMATPNKSAIAQLNKIARSAGNKPVRIIWAPSNLGEGVGKSFGSLAYQAFKDMPNVSIEKYNPGAIPENLAGMNMKFLAKGGPLKSNEMAIVGERGPELLVPAGAGAFNVIPNNQLRYLAEGTLNLSQYARNVTGEPQPDEHDYIDPATGERWLSVTKIQRRGKEDNYGTTYYSDVGSVAHYTAAMALSQQHGIDASHLKFPEVKGAKENNGRWHSAEDIIAQGHMLGQAFTDLANEMGFIPSIIEQRFVNTKDKYSGTIDIGGFIRDELGNLTPVIADFKTSSQVDKGKFSEQIAAYAMMFEDAVQGFVINVNRDMTKMQVVPMDLVKGADRWRESLDWYHKQPMQKGPAASADDIWDQYGEAISGSLPPNPVDTYPGLNTYEESVKMFNQLHQMDSTPSAGPWLIPSSHPLGIPDSAISQGIASSPQGDETSMPLRASGGISGSRAKCKGVDLCNPTMSRFEGWFSSLKRLGGGAGGSEASGRSKGSSGRSGEEGPDYEKEFAEKFLQNVPHAKGGEKWVEKTPIMGFPLQMRRKRDIITARVREADAGNWEERAPRGYWKLLDREEKARNSYHRSLRGMTTSWLIAQHVMRIFGQTSQVYNKAAGAVGQGFGYIMDAFLLPVLPILRPVMSGLIGIGNAIRAFSNPIFMALGGATGLYIAYTFGQWLRQIQAMPYAVNKASDAIQKLVKIFEQIRPAPAASGGGGPTPTPYEQDEPDLEPEWEPPHHGPTPKTKSPYEEWLDKNPEPDISFDSDGATYAEWSEWEDKKKAAGYNKGINKVPGTGNTDSVLAMLTPGEMVIPKKMATQIRGYADGGIVGGATGIMGGMINAYSSVISSDIGRDLIGGLSVISKSVGAMMAPMAPVLAGGALLKVGWGAVTGAINRFRAEAAATNTSGFTALRTIATAQLLQMTSSLGPLVPIGLAAAGIYGWLQGYGATVQGLLGGVRSALDYAKNFLKDIRDFLRPKEVKAEGVPGEKWEWKGKGKFRNLFEGGKYKGRSTPEKPPVDDKDSKVEDDGKQVKEKKGFFDRFKEGIGGFVKGVPGMGALGGIIGAMESKDPLEWAKGAAMGAGSQFLFNVAEKVFGSRIAGGAGGFLAPDFGKTVGHAAISGEGPLAPGQYLGLKGNKGAEMAVGDVVTALLTRNPATMTGAIISDMVGGVGGLFSGGKGGILSQMWEGGNMDSSEMGPFGQMLSLGYNNPALGAMGKALPGSAIGTGGDYRTLSEILQTLKELTGNMKQPTINQNHFEVKADDPYALFQQFMQWLGMTGNTAGIQRTG